LKAFAFEAAFSESFTGTARTRIATAELFDQFLVVVDNAATALHLALTVENPSGACSWIQKLKF
jgi:hypothetical protein